MKDKDYKTFFDVLGSSGGRLMITRPHMERAADTHDLKSATAFDHIEEFDDVGKAIDRAKKMIREDEVLVITGSIFTVGEAMRHMKIQPFPTTIQQAT